MKLKIVAIYQNEDKFCVKELESSKSGVEFIKGLGEAESLLEARKCVPKSMNHKLDRRNEDDPKLIETWM